VTIVGSVLVIASVFAQIGALDSLDTRRGVEDTLAQPPLDGLDLQVSEVLEAIRILAMVTGACAAATAILGWQVMQRSRPARLVLSILAVPMFLAGLVAEVETEILTAQPQAGRDAQTLAAAALRDVAALERGVKIRTLYQHSARRSSITHKYVADVTSRGAEVRTLDEFFNRMIVVDRRVALIPAAEDLRVAVAVREPAIIAYLVDVFERAWERGRPFGDRETSMLKDIAVEQRSMTIRMLIEGHADPVSAKRLGVSPRTYAGYVADLKAEFGAQTRFQIGYAMGRLGITGSERPGEEPSPDDVRGPTDD